VVKKKPKTKEHQKVVNRSPKVTPPTRLLAQQISMWVIISFTLNSNIFTNFSTRIGTCMCDICVLDDLGVVGRLSKVLNAL